jgi:hypothetical protein
MLRATKNVQEKERTSPDMVAQGAISQSPGVTIAILWCIVLFENDFQFPTQN